ncbi:MAG: PEGA domain-containing protein [Syntrophaceae bacterium]|nr:PEGA domain-containing protein [Syntrophaceae bacterium]NTW77120.1 PEGA domain-containing protein [Syntrophaceae bacterium]
MIKAILQMKCKKFCRIFIFFFAFIFLCVGCASTTTIKSRPDGANVYIDNVKAGVTPLAYSDTAIAGSTKALKLKKDGYMPLETVIRKSEFQIGPCIGGLLVLFPFVWILGYPESYEFELEKTIEPEKTGQAEKPVLPEVGKNKVFPYENRLM